MSLHVNLILESEKRSGSNISRRFVIRTFLSVVLALVLLASITFAWSVRSARQNRLFAEDEQKRIDPVYKSVLRQQADLAKLKELVALTEGWSFARIAAWQYLQGLQQQVPDQVQLIKLTLQQNIEKIQPPKKTAPAKKAPAAKKSTQAPRVPKNQNVSQWTGSIYLSGKAMGTESDANVRKMSQVFKTGPFFQDLFDRVDVKRFAADPESLTEDVRIFDMECGLRPRKLLVTQ